MRPADEGYIVELDDRSYEAEQVVIATGPFQAPFTPPVAADLDEGVTQLHSTAYRRLDQLPDGPVVVVGGGNTGYQIAQELVRSHEIHLAIGARQTPLPQTILGRDLFRYLEALGLMARSIDSRETAPKRAPRPTVGARHAYSPSEKPMTTTRKPRMKRPRVGSVANACTEESTPERTRKVPSSESEKASSARSTVHD